MPSGTVALITHMSPQSPLRPRRRSEVALSARSVRFRRWIKRQGLWPYY